MKTIVNIVIVFLVCVGLYTGKTVYPISACAMAMLAILHGQVQLKGDFKTRMFDDDDYDF